MFDLSESKIREKCGYIKTDIVSVTKLIIRGPAAKKQPVVSGSINNSADYYTTCKGDQAILKNIQ